MDIFAYWAVGTLHGALDHLDFQTQNKAICFGTVLNEYGQIP
jgi:hypothetical protein